MTDARALLKRFEKAKLRRNQNWWNHMRECYEYAAPQRETFFHYTSGQKKNTDLFDNTAVMGVQKFASRMQMDMVPPWQKWAMLALDDAMPDEMGEEEIDYDGETLTVNEALERSTDTLFKYIHESNFDMKVYESMIDMSVSTGILTEEFDVENDRLVFNAIPLPETFLEPGPMGGIDNFWREHEIQLDHVLRMWPRAKPSDKLKEQMDKYPQKKAVFVEACLYLAVGKYRYSVIDKARKHTVLEEELESCPFIGFRSMVIPGEVYGRGVVMQNLPTIKTLNLISEFELTSGAISASGVWTGTTDGAFNPYTVQIAPGVVIPVHSNDQRNPTLRSLDTNFDFTFTQLKREELVAELNKAFFANPIGEMDDPTKTATELTMRRQMDLQDSGAFFARLFTELVNKVMERTIYLLSREGKIPPISFESRQLKIKHTSPLAKAMDMEDVQNLNTAMEYTAGLLGPESVQLQFKTENYGAFVGKKLGVEPSMVRTAKERDEMTQKTAEVVNELGQAEAENAGANAGANGAPASGSTGAPVQIPQSI
ncbi:portal protein [uncultured Paraglaciecola sp.]|uniref:portal protein n=1 Tax=uncultured Paraglaciecola sp. TaxID=1765024 RepID=UPI002609E23D|nr:portal protein [uncultured Paraglaciecola sp.]